MVGSHSRFRRGLSVFVLVGGTGILYGGLAGCDGDSSSGVKTAQSVPRHHPLIGPCPDCIEKGHPVGSLNGVFAPPTPVNGGPSTPVGGVVPAGSLWKPVSESTGNPVFLDLASAPEGTATFNGETVSSSGRHNGNRPHYFFGRSCGQYPPNSTLVAPSGTYNIPDPCTRYE